MARPGGCAAEARVTKWKTPNSAIKGKINKTPPPVVVVTRSIYAIQCLWQCSMANRRRRRPSISLTLPFAGVVVALIACGSFVPATALMNAGNSKQRRSARLSAIEGSESHDSHERDGRR
jgi:hypothetical protein